MSEIAKKTVSGSIWMSIARYTSATIQFVGGIYLARTIAPEFFGKKGLAVSILSLISILFVSWGINTALIRRKKSIEQYTRTLFTIRIILVGLFSLTTIILLYPISIKYGKDTAIILLVLLISFIPKHIFGFYGMLLQKKMLFKKIAARQIISVTLSIGIGCFMASIGYKIWALVAILVFANIITATLNLILAPQKIKPGFNKKAAIEFFHYGKYCFLSIGMDRCYRKFDDFSVGTFIGNTALGFYQRAYALTETFARFIYSGISGVISPAFGKLKLHPKKLSKIYEYISSITVRTSTLFYLWLGITVPQFIVIVYGNKWLPAANIFRMIIPYAFISSLRRINRNLQLTAGHSKTAAKAQSFEFGGFIITLFPFLYFWNITGVVLAVDISAVVGIIMLFYYSTKLVNINFKKIFFSPLLAAGLSLILSLNIFNIINWSNIYLKFFGKSGIIIIAFVSVSLILEGQYIKEIIKTILAQRKKDK